MLSLLFCEVVSSMACVLSPLTWSREEVRKDAEAAYAPLQLVHVAVADALGGVVRKTDERSALAVTGFVHRPPRRFSSHSCFGPLYRRTAAATASLLRPLLTGAVLPVHYLW